MIRCAKKITQPLPAPSKLHGPACQQSNVGSKCDPFNWTNKRNTSRIAIFRHPCKPSIASSTSSGDNEKRTTKTMDGTVSLEIVQVEKNPIPPIQFKGMFTKFSHFDSPLHLLPGSRISRKVLHRDVWLPLAT